MKNVPKAFINLLFCRYRWVCLKDPHLLEWFSLCEPGRRVWLPLSFWTILHWRLSPWRRLQAERAGVDPERGQMLRLLLQGREDFLPENSLWLQEPQRWPLLLPRVRHSCHQPVPRPNWAQALPQRGQLDLQLPAVPLPGRRGGLLASSVPDSELRVHSHLRRRVLSSLCQWPLSGWQHHLWHQENLSRWLWSHEA